MLRDEELMKKIFSRHGDYSPIPQEYMDKEIERESNLSTINYAPKTFVVAVATLIVAVFTLIVTILK